MTYNIDNSLTINDKAAVWFQIEPKLRKSIEKKREHYYVDEIIDITMEEFFRRYVIIIGFGAAYNLALRIALGTATRKARCNIVAQDHRCPYCGKYLSQIDGSYICINSCCELLNVVIPTKLLQHETISVISLDSGLGDNEDGAQATHIDRQIMEMTYNPFEEVAEVSSDSRNLRRVDLHKLALNAIFKSGRLNKIQTKICELLIEGLSGQEIAAVLGIHKCSVSRHKATIRNKVLCMLNHGETLEFVDGSYDSVPKPAFVRIAWHEKRGQKKVVLDELVTREKVKEINGPVQFGFIF